MYLLPGLDDSDPRLLQSGLPCTAAFASEIVVVDVVVDVAVGVISRLGAAAAEAAAQVGAVVLCGRE